MRALPLLLLAAACAPATDAPEIWSFDDAPPAATEGFTEAPQGEPLPPPVANLSLDHAAMVGAPVSLTVRGLPPSTSVTLFATFAGTGSGPCHPSGLCLDLLSPRALGGGSTDANGELRVQISPPGARNIAFQAVIPGSGTSNALPVAIADVSMAWAYDLLDVSVVNGESGYAFGMAETYAGPYGWYGEECDLGGICHVFPSSLTLQSVHPDVGGPGLGFVSAGVNTLLWEIHGPYTTYFLEGLDSGDCFTWGDDTSYYPDCVVIN